MKKMRIWVAAFAATISLMPCLAQEPQKNKSYSYYDEDGTFIEITNIENVVVEEPGKENDIFQVVETMPEFPGGTEELINWLQKNLKYPAKAAENDVQGRVIVQFVIDQDGSITDPKVVRSLDPSCDKEAIRLVKAMPKWKPGMQHGTPVRVKFTLPIRFRKADKEEPQKAQTISETIEIVEDDAYVSDNDSNIEIDDSTFNAIIKSMSVGKKKEPKKNSEDEDMGEVVEITNIENVVVEESKKEDEVFQVVETMPEFPGGTVELMKWLRENIKYPSVAASNYVQGRVIVEFVVNQDGSITDPKVIRSVDPYLDKEAIRVVKAMPKWKPGTQRGKPVRVKFTLPVQFRLDGGKVNKNNIQRTETPQRRNAAYSSRGGKGSIKSAFEALGTPAKKVEVMPEFIGGEEAMLQFLTKQADYAEIEESSKAFGQQYIIKFIVGADGKLRDHAILRGIPTEVAEKALNIVKAMPDWKPGTVNGTPKDMLYAVALPFKVTKKEAATAPKKP